MAVDAGHMQAMSLVIPVNSTGFTAPTPRSDVEVVCGPLSEGAFPA